MGKKKIGIIVAACAAIVICSSVIIGVTYALWNDRVTVNNHLSAGTLSVQLDRTGYEKTGTITKKDTTTVSLSGDSKVKNVFDFKSGDAFNPRDTYSADLKLTNTGDVDVVYSVIITLDSKASEAFADQLKVYIDGTEKGMLSSFNKDGKIVIDESSVSKKSSGSFSVKIEYVDSVKNNDVMGETVDFDLIVEVTQKVG